MTETKPLLDMPQLMQRELDAIGVRRAASSRPAAEVIDWSFKRPVVDANNQPEF